MSREGTQRETELSVRETARDLILGAEPDDEVTVQVIGFRLP